MHSNRPQHAAQQCKQTQCNIAHRGTTPCNTTQRNTTHNKGKHTQNNGSNNEKQRLTQRTTKVNTNTRQTHQDDGPRGGSSWHRRDNTSAYRYRCGINRIPSSYGDSDEEHIQENVETKRAWAFGHEAGTRAYM